MAEVASELLARLKRDARHRCGYCLTSELITGHPLTVDHLTPVARGGSYDEENLWMACRRCNERKGVQTEAVDPETRALTPLFHPRRQRWHEHFTWSGDGARIVGLSACGRATVEALRMNNEEIVAARRLWVGVGWHPPQEA
jgi:hypothetical protein